MSGVVLRWSTLVPPVGTVSVVVMLLVLSIAVGIGNSGDVVETGSFNQYYNEVVERDDLRGAISRQLPKQGKFFEEFDRSKYTFVVLLSGGGKMENGNHNGEESNFMLTRID